MKLDPMVPIRIGLKKARNAVAGGEKKEIVEACHEIKTIEPQRHGSVLPKDLGDECGRIFEALCDGSLREEGTAYRPRDLSKAQRDALVARLDAVLAAIA